MGTMEYTTLEKTGLRISVAGLGCGGPSRLGMRNDPQSEKNAVGIIKQALELGVNFLDTAQTYGTEPVVGKAISGVPRASLVISTKKTLPPEDHADPQGEVLKGLEQSLKLIGPDYIDIYHLHGVEPKDYPFCKEHLMPAMHRLKEQGKIRFIGVTEGFVPDPSHTMLQQSLKENLWDVVMVGFSLLNSSARATVFPLTMKNGIGVLNMFAVRRALSQPRRLKEVCAGLVSKNAIAPGSLDANDPLGFILRESDAATLPEAAYRYCRHEKAVNVVLTGTGNSEHLKENIAAITKPALPRTVLDRIDQIFGNLNFITGN
jgi:aryl-alcohol dehydrogenase-like predicted oxidoreductase